MKITFNKNIKKPNIRVAGSEVSDDKESLRNLASSDDGLYEIEDVLALYI